MKVYRRTQDSLTAFCCPLADNLQPSDPIHTAGSGEKLPHFEELAAEAVAKTMPAVLKGHFASPSLLGQNDPKDNVETVTKSTDAATDAAPVPKGPL